MYIQILMVLHSSTVTRYVEQKKFFFKIQSGAILKTYLKNLFYTKFWISAYCDLKAPPPPTLPPLPPATIFLKLCFED